VRAKKRPRLPSKNNYPEAFFGSNAAGDHAAGAIDLVIKIMVAPA
jgi:hypothetical protein